MNTLTAARFTVKNLDCASCAAKIETALRRVEGVRRGFTEFQYPDAFVESEEHGPGSSMKSGASNPMSYWFPMTPKTGQANPWNRIQNPTRCESL